LTTDRTPVRTLDDLATLDDVEVVEGYHDGREGFPCGENRSRSYWHGHRNGRADAGLTPLDDAMRELAHVYVEAVTMPVMGRA